MEMLEQKYPFSPGRKHVPLVNMIRKNKEKQQQKKRRSTSALLISVMSRGDRAAVLVLQERLQVPHTEESSGAIPNFLHLTEGFCHVVCHYCYHQISQ